MSNWRIHVTGPNGAEAEGVIDDFVVARRKGPKIESILDEMRPLVAAVLQADAPPSGNGETQPRKEPGARR